MIKIVNNTIQPLFIEILLLNFRGFFTLSTQKYDKLEENKGVKNEETVTGKRPPQYFEGLDGFLTKKMIKD